MSSPIEALIASNPTGPPLNFSIIAVKYLWSVTSKPHLSIFNLSNACLVNSISIVPSANTNAKSLNLLNKRFAILGVPLDLFASSSAASLSILIPKISLDLSIIVVKPALTSA